MGRKEWMVVAAVVGTSLLVLGGCGGGGGGGDGGISPGTKTKVSNFLKGLFSPDEEGQATADAGSAESSGSEAGTTAPGGTDGSEQETSQDAGSLSPGHDLGDMTDLLGTWECYTDKYGEKSSSSSWDLEFRAGGEATWDGQEVQYSKSRDRLKLGNDEFVLTILSADVLEFVLNP